MSNLPAVGISLGSTYSSIGVFRNGRITVIPDEQGNHRIPSCVAFARTKCLVGERAKDYGALNPSQAVHSIKRLLGRTYDDPHVQANLHSWPFNIVNYCGRPRISMECNGATKSYSPEDVAAMLLLELKRMAEKYLGEKLSDVVIAVPFGFNRFQRQAIEEACELAGLNVKRVLTESTAAALAFFIHGAISAASTAKHTQNVLVFDFGGGACSVSVASFEDDVIEVLSTAGESNLGGEDFNNLLVSYFVEKFRQKHKLDLRCSASAMQRLRTACEHAKRTLSSCAEAAVELDSLIQGTDMRAKISRAQFEDLCSDLFRRAIALVREALDVRHIRKEDIDEIIVIGGSTRIPRIQNLLTEYFNGKRVNFSFYPNEATVYGAAIQAAITARSQDLVLHNMLLMDTVPFSMGIETADGTMAVVLGRNDPLPTKRTIFCTTQDHQQPAVTIKVYEGKYAVAKNNLFIRRFDHFGIAPAPRGAPRIAVTFGVDADGELSVSVEDKSSDLDSVPSDERVYSLAYLP